MKATGIVRRIEARVIIAQKWGKALWILSFWAIFEEKFLTKNGTFWPIHNNSEVNIHLAVACYYYIIENRIRMWYNK